MGGTCDYAPVGVDDLGADKGRAATALEYVEINAFAAQCQPVLLHFGDHLHRVASYRQTCHVKSEIGVGGAAACHGVKVTLHAVDIKYDGFRACSGHRIGNLNLVVDIVASLRKSGGDIVAARQAQTYHLDADVGRFALLLAGGRICSGSGDVDVARAEQKILGKVECVGAFADILLRFTICCDNAALYDDFNRGFLPGALPGFLACELMVVTPCQHG